jgi:hypothetical protein
MCSVGGLSLGVRMVKGHVALRDASRREFFFCALLERLTAMLISLIAISTCMKNC